MAEKSVEPTTPGSAEPATDPQATPITPAPADPAAVEPTKEPVQDAEFWRGKAQAMEKDVKKSAKRLAELEEAERQRQEAAKTDLEKANERAQRAEAEKKALELQLLRQAVATETGLPPALAERLQGSDKDALLADAKQLMDAMPKPAAAAGAAGQVASTTKKTNPPVSTQQTDKAWNDFLFNNGPLPQ